MKTTFPALSCLLLLAIGSQISSADTLEMKDGRRIEGFVLGFSRGKINLLRPKLLPGKTPLATTKFEVNDIACIQIKGLNKFNAAEKLRAAGKNKQALEAYALPANHAHDRYALPLLLYRRLILANQLGRYDQAVADWLELLDRWGLYVLGGGSNSLPLPKLGQSGSAENTKGIGLLEAKLKTFTWEEDREFRFIVLGELMRAYEVQKEEKNLRRIIGLIKTAPPEKVEKLDMKNQFFASGGGNVYNVVYLVDGSAALKPAKEQLCTEITRSVGRIHSRQMFQMVLVSAASLGLLGDKELLPPLYRFKAEAQDLVEKAEYQGQGDVAKGFEKAYRILEGAKKRGKLIYFITAGVDEKQEKAILQLLEKSKEKKVLVNVFLYNSHATPEVIQRLKRIAEKGGGRFREVPASQPTSQPAGPASQPVNKEGP